MTIFIVDPNNPLLTDPTISNFDPSKDFIQLSNPSADEVLTYFSYTDYYTLEVVDENTQILTTEGELVAVIEGVTELKPFTGYTPEGAVYLVSLENQFFSNYVEPSFFEPWYLEQDALDYGNSVQEAINAGLVDSAYEHFLEIGQFEGREDDVFFGTAGDDILYGMGAEPVLIGVPITEAVYARDNKPVTTGVGELDTLVGAPGGDTFVLGNGTTLNDAPQSYYVGGGDEDYALIKGFSGSSVSYPALAGYEDATIDRLFLAGKHYDYLYEKVGEDLRVSTRNGDLVAIIEDAPIMETPFSIPGANYLYGIDNVNAFDALWGASSGFYDPFYFAMNPGVEEAIERGEYESAVDHYFKVGQFQADSEVIFHDPNNEGFVVGYGPSDLLFGVPLTFFDGETEGYRTATTGVGEQDFYLGGVGVTTYFIGNDNILDPGTKPEVWYVGQGDEDYVTIQNFDPYKDFIFAVGEFADYTFETVETTVDIVGRIVPIQNLEISYQGDLVAVLNNVGGSLTVANLTLQEFDFGDERPNAFAFVAPQNEFLPPPKGSEFFNEAVYLAFNPEIAGVIGEGKPYATVLDYYIQVGQYREDGGGHGYFDGTSGNDVIKGFGFDKDLFGVAYTSVSGQAPGEITFVPETLGVGEIDTFIGSPGVDGFYAAAFTSVDFGNFVGDAAPLYIGEGDGDYVLIRGFDSAKDYFALAGKPSDYIYKVESGDFKVFSNEGDLVAIIQDTIDLKVENVFDTFNLFTFEGDDSGQELGFDEDVYLGIYPDVAQLIEDGFFSSALEHYLLVGQYEEGGTVYTGTGGNDVLVSWTQNAEVRLAGVEFEPAEPAGYGEGQYYFGVRPTTFGVGEVDVLIHSADTGTITESLLGFFRNADGSINRFYVGQGDADYALVKNFDKNDIDELFFGGAPEDYTFEDVDGNLRVSYQGDLVTIVEGVQFNELELASEGEGSGAFVLIGIPDAELPFTGEIYNIDRNATEPLVIENFDRTQDIIAISSGQKDYTFEAVDGDLNISTKDGMLVAVIVGGGDIKRLTPYPYVDETGKLYLVDSTNSSLAEAIEPTFFALYYPVQNPDVDALIAQGLYTSYFDHFIRAGQFEEREDTFFGGTAGDDIVTGFGNESILTGVVIESTEYIEGLDIVPGSLGVGEQDILIGGSGYTIFQLGNGEILNDQAQVFYVGQGDADYALIKNLNVSDDGNEYDVVNLPGYYDEYTYETVDGNFHIFKDGDLVAIVEGHSVLFPANVANGFTKFAAIGDPYFDKEIGQYFNESAYLNANLDAKAAVEAGEYSSGFNHFLSTYLTEERLGGFSGTSGDDVFNGINGAVYLGVEVSDLNLETLSFENTSTGAGEYDYVYAGAGSDTLILGNPGTGETFYLGQGDSDYFQIEGFDPKRDRLLLAGEFEDYTFEAITKPEEDDAYVKILKDGDLVAEVRTTYPFKVALELKFFTGNNPEGGFYLVSTEYEDPEFPFSGEVYNIDPDATTPLIIENFDSTQDAIALPDGQKNYKFEAVDGNLNISTIEGKLVAVVNGGETYKFSTFPYTDDTGKLYLVDTLNPTYAQALEPPFYESAYPIQNPDVDALIAAGEYTSYFDHFIKAGQFEDREDTFFLGTGQNDVLVGLGAESIISGVEVSAVDYSAYLDVKPVTTGEGEVDTYIGGSGFDIFLVGNGWTLNEEPQPFYVGQGDADYALIKNINSADFDIIRMAGNWDDYTYETIGNDFHISTQEGDLVAIAEDQPDLVPWFYGGGLTLLLPGELLQPGGDADVSAYFQEDLYLAANPDVAAAIAAGEYASGYDHLLKIGIFEDRQVVFQGTSGSDGFGPIGNAIQIGVETQDFNPETLGFTPESFGVGEQDYIEASGGDSLIILGSNGVLGGEAKSFYVGNGDEDFMDIYGFDPKNDRLLVAGFYEDYTYELIEEGKYGGQDYNIYKDGDLVASLSGVKEDFELKPFTGNNPEGGTYLLSLENEFFSKYSEPAFFAPYYPIQNPDVVELVESGQYASYYDHFLKAGQFEQLEDTFFQGTEGNDTLYSIGYENILVGVPITEADYINGLDVVPVNTGTGQIDTLIGNGANQKETIFVLGNGTVLNETSQTFYLGEGDADYALIKNFQPRDRIFLGSDSAQFTLEAVDGNLHISKSGDLVAIIENRTELVPSRENELGTPDIEFFTTGTAGNDTLYSSVRQNTIVGVAISAAQFYGGVDVVPVSTGVGEVDTLYGLSGRSDTFLLGTNNLLNQTPQSFYVGQGDADYALIKNFTPNDLYDTVILAGEVSDYRFEIQAYEGTGDDTKIYTKDGDLIALIEDVALAQAYDDGETLTLYASNINGSAEAAAEYFSDIEPFFYEDFYLDENPEVAALISSGEFGSAFEHYLEVVQFAEESEVIFAGTSGNDYFAGIGKSDLLFGVPLTSVDGEKEGWTSATTGVGEQDTLGGGLGVTTFFIGNDQILDPSKPNEIYYVGEGDQDYALIQGFQPTQDFIFAAGLFSDYTLETIDGDLKISYGSDLVAIVDDAEDLTLQEFDFGDERPNGFAFVAPENEFYQDSLPTEQFNEQAYLNIYADAAQSVKDGQFASGLEHYAQVGQFEDVEEDGVLEPRAGIFTGTEGDDTLIGWGRAAVLSGVGFDVPDPNTFGITSSSLGVGEIDTLVGQAGTFNTFALGLFKNPASPKAQKFYVGGGDEDYALIKNFSAADGDNIILAGKPRGYTLNAVEGNLEISTRRGDLVGIVEGVTDLGVTEVFKDLGIFVVAADSTV